MKSTTPNPTPSIAPAVKPAAKASAAHGTEATKSKKKQTAINPPRHPTFAETKVLWALARS